MSQPRPAIPEKSPFFEVSKKHAVEIEYNPLIRVVGVSLKEFRGQRVEILDHTAVIFTSRTTVDSFFHICEEARITVPETMKYICQTEAVALYLQKYIVYRKRKISFADGSFTNFIELIIKHKEERFLLALSEPHKPELPETLAKLKLKVDPVILARTVATDLHGVDLKAFDLMALYSPSDVKALIQQASAGELPHIATFGEGTLRAAFGPLARGSVDGPCRRDLPRTPREERRDRRRRAEDRHRKGGVHPHPAAQAGQEEPFPPNGRTLRKEIVT